MDKVNRMALLAGFATVAAIDVPKCSTSGDNEPNVKHNPSPYVGRAVGRNQPCPCGSGKKYKRCCMRSFE